MSFDCGPQEAIALTPIAMNRMPVGKLSSGILEECDVRGNSEAQDRSADAYPGQDGWVIEKCGKAQPGFVLPCPDDA